MMHDSSHRRYERLVYYGLIGLVGACYLLTAARHYIGGDQGLFAIIFAEGGYAHAPGYPLYALYLQAMSWLPATSPAHGASLATALLGAASLAVLYAAGKAWKLSPFAAALGTLCFGVGPEAWFLHTQAEVFALNHLIAAAILLFSAPQAPVTGLRRTCLLGLLAGLGLSNHHTIVLLTPIGLYGAILGLREDDRPWRAALLGVVTLAAGLLPYLYLTYVSRMAPELWHWGDAGTWSGLIDVFLRSDYGTFQLSAGDGDLIPGVQLAFFGTSVLADFLYLPAIAGLGGLLVTSTRALRHDKRRDRRDWGWLMLAASALLVGPFFVTLLPRTPEGLDFLVIRRFHLLFECVFALFVGAGADLLIEHLKKPPVRIAIAAAIVVAGGARAFPYVADHQGPTVEQYLTDSLEALPRDAVLVGTGDHHSIGFAYLQRTRRLRDDVTYVEASMLSRRWYIDRLEERSGLSIPYQGTNISLPKLIGALQRQDRPVALTHVFHRNALVAPATPLGPNIQLHFDGAPPPPREVYRRNVEFQRTASEIAPRPYAAEHSWSRHVLSDYADRWSTIADALERTGATREARQAREIEHRLVPWRRSETDE